jgi:hypothetical protein
MTALEPALAILGVAPDERRGVKRDHFSVRLVPAGTSSRKLPNVATRSCHGAAPAMRRASNATGG